MNKSLKRDIAAQSSQVLEASHNWIADHFDLYAKRRIEWRNRGWYYHSHLEEYLKFLIRSDARILELGCATGDTLAALEPKRGVGVDISPNMVDVARKRHPDLEFVVGDAEDPPIEERFDYVLMINTLGYLDDIQHGLCRLHKVCTSETRVVIIYFNYLWRPFLNLTEKLGLRMPGKERHWLPSSDIKNLLELAGFEVVREARRVVMPFHVPLLSAFLNKVCVNLPLFKQMCLNTLVVARPIISLDQRDNSSISIIVPCRNEKGNIENVVHSIVPMGSHTEVIFVEGHSSDNTYEECLRVQASYPEHDIKVLRQDGEGKADAVRKGFAAASGDILMILDADLTVSPEDLPKFYDALVTGKGEFINGSRLVYDMEDGAMMALNFLGNKFFSWAFSALLSQKLRDTLCGTKALWKTDYEKIEKGRTYFGDFDPFGDFDLLFGASKLNLKILEVPIRYRKRAYGETQIRRFSHGILLLRMVLFACRRLKFI